MANTKRFYSDEVKLAMDGSLLQKTSEVVLNNIMMLHLWMLRSLARVVQRDLE
jgi:hypothetical protein